MANLIEIQSQIEKLQKQASDIRAKEFEKTIKDILAKMEAFGITLKDLQRAQGKGGKVRAKATGRGAATKKAGGKRRSNLAGSSVAPKYRGPNGETWSGRGLMPKWLAALVEQGRSKEEFAIGA